MRSMRTSINRFLARATGPTKLRSELSQKTKPMSMLLDKIDLASAVRAEVPENVLGGDILALMSEQLRQAIQYSGQDESATDDVPKSQFRLESQPGSIADRAEAETSTQLLPAKRSADPFSELRSESRKQETGFPKSALDFHPAEGWPSALPGDVKTARPALEPEKTADSDRRHWTLKSRESADKHIAAEQADATTFIKKLQEYRHLTQQERASETVSGLPDSPGERDRKAAATFPESTPRAVPGASWSGLENDAAPGREDLFSSTGKTDSVEGSEPQNTTPVLVEKLREYWRLSRPENSPEKIPAHPGSPITERSNADTSFPALPRYTIAPGSWPEMTGRQVAEKIDSFISGRGAPGLARSVRQVIQSDLPEKVEIQNVFNIQVRSEESRGNSRDLSEEIADILHEQALQHGIDVT